MPIYNRIAEFHDDMTAWRREIHSYPELCYEEERTASLVARQLASWGIEVHTGLAKTGVVGVLRGQGASKRSVGLRADMDALPLNEENDLPYRSQVPGKMHACGHDGHTTMLLGAARYLAETRNFDGTVTFIFQPAEEGGGGAKVMMDEGLFERFPCDTVWGVHNDPGLPLGSVGFRPGGFMASSDLAHIVIRGRGAHAALPHEGIDPIAVGFHLYQGLQLIVSRNVDPVVPVVASVCEFHAGTAHNVIAGTATMSISIRTTGAELRSFMESRVRELCDGIAKAHGCSIDLDYVLGYPPLVNDAAETNLAAEVAEELLGAQSVNRDSAVSMGSDDFAYLLDGRRGAYLFMGQGVPGKDVSLHHPRYDFNDDLLPIGASYFARLVERVLPRSEGNDAPIAN